MAFDAPHETEPRRVRIWALTQGLTSHGYVVVVAESEPLLVVSAPGGPTVQVRCDHRAVCGGELWFYLSGGAPIAPADDAHMNDSVVAINGKLAVVET